MTAAEETVRRKYRDNQSDGPKTLTAIWIFKNKFVTVQRQPLSGADKQEILICTFTWIHIYWHWSTHITTSTNKHTIQPKTNAIKSIISHRHPLYPVWQKKKHINSSSKPSLPPT